MLALRASHVSAGDLTADSAFTNLVETWLEYLNLEDKLACAMAYGARIRATLRFVEGRRSSPDRCVNNERPLRGR